MKYALIIFFIFFLTLTFLIVKTLRLPVKIKKAEEFMEAGDYSRAGEIIRKILDKNKNYAPARYIRALLLIKQNQYLLAISELNTILSIPDFNKSIKEVDIHYHLAELYSNTSNYQKEVEEYKLILIFNPDDVKANHRLGHALYKGKNYNKAREHLLKAVVLEPGLTDCFLPLGVSFFHLSNFEKAEQFLSKSLKLPGSHHEAEFYLGNIYKMGKAYETAVSMLKNAKKNRDFFLRSTHLLAEIYFEQEDYENAISQMEDGLDKVNDDYHDIEGYWYLLAECYEQDNRIEEAIILWEKIVVRTPSYRNTRIKLDSYKTIMDNDIMMSLFTSSLEELQPLIRELISGLNYNIVSSEQISANEIIYKVYNIKRINDPSLLVYFDRTTREIPENKIIEFYKRISSEEYKSGIYIATSKFSLKAKSTAVSKVIDLYDRDFVNKAVKKIVEKKKKTDA